MYISKDLTPPVYQQQSGGGPPLQSPTILTCKQWTHTGTQNNRLFFCTLVTAGCVQTPDLGRDQEIVNAAKNIMFNSAQKFRLTELSGRRDMSLLLAQSAVQVCTHSHRHVPAACTAITPSPRRDPEGALGSTAQRWVSAVVNSVVQPGSWLVHIAAHDMSSIQVLMHHPGIFCSQFLANLWCYLSLCHLLLLSFCPTPVHYDAQLVTGADFCVDSNYMFGH